MKGCIDTSNPSNKLPIYKTPNPFKILKSGTGKIASILIKLTRMDRIAMEVLLATMTVPDEKLKAFMETKFTKMINDVSEPVKEAMDKLGGDIIEPFFRAIPFVNLTYILGDLQKAANSVDDIQGKGAQALETIIGNARELYEDIQGPSRVLSSLILGLGEYIEKIQRKIDSGQTLTQDDIAAINLYKHIGKDDNTSPSKDTPRRAAARSIATNLIKALRTEADNGIPLDTDIVKLVEPFLLGDGENTGAERKELAGIGKNEDGLFKILTGQLDGRKRKTRKTIRRRFKKSRQTNS